LQQFNVQWRIQGGGAVGAAASPLLAHIFEQKAAYFRVKDMYFVVRICDK